MPCWFYEKTDLEKTPSRKDSIDQGTEARYRREGARFIMEAGTSLNLGYDTMATGVVYFHRFYMFHSFKEFPRYLTGAACLFLAGKVEETPKKCKDIIRVVKELLPQHHFAAFGEDPKEEIMTYERILLQTIKFDLQVEHPYSYLLKYAKSFKGDKDKIQKLVQMAWTFVNDSLCTTLSLQWEPHITAVAFLYLAGRLSKSDLMDWSGKSTKIKWWEQLSEDVSLDIMEEVCHQLLDLYAAGKNKAGANTPVKSAKKKPIAADAGEKSKDEPKTKALKKGIKTSTPPPPPPPPSTKSFSSSSSSSKDTTKGNTQLPVDVQSSAYLASQSQVMDLAAPQMTSQLPPQAPVPPMMPPMVSYGTPPPSQGAGYGFSGAASTSYSSGGGQSSFSSGGYGGNFMGSQVESKEQPSYDQKKGQYSSSSFSTNQQSGGQKSGFPEQFGSQFGVGGGHNYSIPPPVLPSQQAPGGSSGMPPSIGSMKSQGMPPHPLLPPNPSHISQRPSTQGTMPPVPPLIQLGASNSPLGAGSYQQTSSSISGGYGGSQSNVGSGPRPLMSMPITPSSSMATVRITGRQFSQQHQSNKPASGGWKM